MSDSTKLQLPYLAAAQSQKHVTVNESLRKLDAVVQLTVVSATTAAQPGAPSDGDCYILPAGKTGADWGAMTDLSVAYYVDGAWSQLSPKEGWRAWVADADKLLIYDGAAWSQISGGRDKLTADRDYYVRTDGNDANDGLSDSAAGAFATIQKAVDVVSALDLSIYTATIHVGAGTYDEAITINAPLIGGAGAVIVGDTGTPSNVVLDAAAPGPTFNAAIEVLVDGWTISGLRFQSTSGYYYYGVHANACGVTIDNCEFGPGFSGYDVRGDLGASISLTGSIVYTSGSHACALGASQGTNIVKASADTITCSGTPSFSNAFAFAYLISSIRLTGSNVTGAATGKKYNVTYNSVLIYQGGASNLPGDVAGVTGSGGQAA